MSCALTDADLVICKGKTFTQVFAWESDQIVFKPITGITKAAPPVISAPGHGLVQNWRAAVGGVKGMREINALHTPPRDADFHVVTTAGADAISLPINALDYGTYTGGGTLIYYLPVDLDGFTARLSIKDKIAAVTANLWQSSTAYAAGDYVAIAGGVVLECTVAGTSGVTEPAGAGTDGSVAWALASTFRGSRELLRLTTENGGIALDNIYKTITATISAADTAALDFRRGVYELEMVSGDAEPEVTSLVAGKITVHEEVTT